MKKISLFLLLFFVLLIFVGCNRELYTIEDKGYEATTSITAIPGFQYTNSEKEYAVTPSEYIWYSTITRGILFMPNNGILSIYNPEIGTLNTLCPDPLCSHQPYSGCPYGNCIFTGSIPLYSDDRLYYFVKDQYLEKETLISEYKIYSTDITGQSIKKHYESNGNYIFGLTIREGRAYFLEFQDEHYTLLKFIDLNNNQVNTIPTDGLENLVILSFICMNDRIYYMMDNGRIYSCNMEFGDVRFEYDTKRAPTIYGRKDIGTIFWCLDNVIYMYDTETMECSRLVELDDSLKIFNMFIEDEGLYYQAFPATTNYSMTYKEYVESIQNYNDLHMIEPESKIEYTYKLPETLYLEANAITVCNGLLIAQTYIENVNTKMLAGRPYYAYDLASGLLYLVTGDRPY